MNSNVKMREYLKYDTISFMKRIVDMMYKEHMERPGIGITASCISCLNFNERDEICKLANERPPARVIAFGCPKYDDIDDIPF